MLRFFKTMGLMESGPDALLGFRLQSSFMMPGTDIAISGIGWYLLWVPGRFARESFRSWVVSP